MARSTRLFMTIPEHLKFRLRRCTLCHVGYGLAAGSVLLVPAHFYISCEASGGVFGVSLVLLLVTLGLAFATPRTTARRFRPAAFALLAVVAHMFSTH